MDELGSNNKVGFHVDVGGSSYLNNGDGESNEFNFSRKIITGKDKSSSNNGDTNDYDFERICLELSDKIILEQIRSLL